MVTRTADVVKDAGVGVERPGRDRVRRDMAKKTGEKMGKTDMRIPSIFFVSLFDVHL